MPTKLSRYCEGVMEAAWLAAVILVPVFFNIYSSRIFEPDKIALLRSIALIVLGAWVVKLIEERGIRWEKLEPEGSKLRYLIRFPLLAPVFALAVIYILATIFSVTPRVSLLGSYQRFQGAYTTLSYLIIFAALAVHLRRKTQLERLITIIVLTSLPISLYGVLQKYKIDPIPWGGDTSLRIAANMGNSIFVAAFLIMVFPLTVARIVDSFKAILRDEMGLVNHIIRATLYVFMATLQLIALYMSGSRGPALGWMAGSFFLFLLLARSWNKRWMTLSIISTAGVLAIFLFVFNLPGGPLEGLRSSPAIGRFGLLLDSQSNSALVRKYIWQGAADLVAPHDPLEYPNGKQDVFNIVRPIIGYGPESMYVAYNPFYIPELAQVEKRNASPDRSHNETWDSLVITGFLGIFVYLALFISIFYYGFKWIGLIQSKRHKYLYLAVVLGAGILGAVGLGLWRGVEYFGVGLPFGILIGLFVYITIEALAGSYDPPQSSGEGTRSLVLIVLIAAIISHFVEINFGIAIASTRMYFWVYSGLLVTVGYILPVYRVFETGVVQLEQQQGNNEADKRAKYQSMKKKRRSRTPVVSVGQRNSLSLNTAFSTSLIISILVAALGYNYLNNPGGSVSLFEIIWSSVSRLPNQNWSYSLGILGLILFTWIAAVLVISSERVMEHPGESWWKIIVATLGASMVFILIFWIWHAGRLASIARNTASDLDGVLQQVARYESLLTSFYIYIILLIFLLGLFLSQRWAVHARRVTFPGLASGLILISMVLGATAYTNLQVIQADIVFKLAEPFARTGQWPVAIRIYERANQLAPNEDYYYLFLGRAYLEYAKVLSEPTEREGLIQQAELDLRKAQSINPLNTDHTANLGRLFNLWASFSADPGIRAEKGERASEFFSRAVKLSPNNARLWDEWALLYLNILQLPDEAYPLLLKSLEVDPEYHWTYGILGDFYIRQSQQSDDPEFMDSALREAAKNYAKALELPTPGEPQADFSYAIALGGAYTQLEQFKGAIDVYTTALQIAPTGVEIWRIEEAIASLYLELNDYSNALIHAQNASDLAPADQKDRLRSFMEQIKQLQS